MGLRAKKPFWQDAELDDGGFSTVGVALALLISLSLVFAGAQVYRVQSVAAEIQEVADAAALAADNVVAEYYLVARVCDALVLSLSLTGIVVLGMGVAALCSPISAPVGSTLIDAGRKVLKARDRFARRAASGLDKLQKAIPFLTSAAAYRVAAANKDAGGSPYLGIALAFPFEGKEVSAGDGAGSGSLVNAIDDAADELTRAGEEAEKAAKDAKSAKERGYQADCGANPGYCLFERAASLAHLQGSSNPYFSSVETWGFSVALNRAKAYYPARLAAESPESDSLDDQVNSALRKRFYEYAAQAVGEGHVVESGDTFEADFPLLPKNTAEMKETRLYTDAVYPVTVNESGLREMHAWDGCPRAAGAIERGSLAQREGEGHSLCPACEFTADSLGAVAAASSSINNGFEYHYRIIAQAAQEYEEVRKKYDPKAQRVRTIAGTLFDRARDALHGMASQRIVVAPPGRFGVVSIVMSTGVLSSHGWLGSRFISDAGDLGTRVAIAGATLVSDSSEQGRTVISSILDGVRNRTDSRLLGVLAGVMDVWSAALFAYADGQTRLGDAIDELDSRLALGSESRLGLWSAAEFSKAMESVGLQPAELDAPKPVVVNTAHILNADGGEVSARLLGVKRVASNLTGSTALEGAVAYLERQAAQSVEDFDGEITIAEIDIAGEGSPTIPLVLTLPDFARADALDLISRVGGRLQNWVRETMEVRPWR